MGKHGIVALLLLGLLWPASGQAATIPAASVPGATLVAETTDSLEQLGCQPFSLAEGQPQVVAVPGMPFHVVSNSSPEEHFWCSPATAGELTVVAGQVAGIRDLLIKDAQAQGLATCAFSPLVCSIMGIYNSAGTIKDAATTAILAEVSRVVSWLASAAGALGILLIYAGTGLLGFLITQGGFVTNDAVRIGWPIIQGLANIGFVIALLYIAFATTLNLTISGQPPRRFLPRLLIAAILLNFSLVLAGILIDVSRLLNAIIVQLMLGADNPAAIGPHLLQSSKLIEQSFDTALSGWVTNLLEAGKNVTPLAWLKDYHEVIGLAMGAALIWAYALVMWFLIVLFFFRYVVLVILLVFSPIAFLTSVLPNTKETASKWWQQFWKWTLFGPAALFILALAVRIQENLAFVPDDFSGASLMNSVANVVLMVVMLYVAATVGKYIGGSAATLAMAVSKRGSDAVRQYGGAGLRAGARFGALPYTAGARAATATAGAAGKYVGSTVSQNVKDFTSKAGGDFVKKARAGDYGRGVQFVAGPERNKDGSLKSGQSSAGSYLGRTLSRATGNDMTNEQRRQLQDAQDQIQAGRALAPGSNAARQHFRTALALRPDQLRKDNIAGELTADELAYLATSTDATPEQRQAVLSQPEAIRKLLRDRPAVIQQVFSEPTDTDLPTNLTTNPAVAGSAAAAAANDATNRQNQRTNAENKRNQEMIKALNKGLAELEKKNRGTTT
mgnify:CR=1 FL=1